jgi:WD40 repeat protein
VIEKVALSPAAQAGELLPETPFVGLVPYREEDAPFFFGRDEEKQIVAGNLRASRLTILYGPSGVGKTSLLQAGVVHDLRRQVQERADGSLERAPFAISSFNAWRDEPLPALVGAIRAAAAEALGGLEPEAWRPGEPLVEALRVWTGRVRTLLVVLDQFEDYFLYHPEDDGEGSFFVEFPRVVNEPNLRVNFLLSIREDSWAKLDRFEGRIPRLFVNYVRVEHLDREAARDAIEEPVAEWNRRLPPEERPYTVEPALVEAVIAAAAAGGLTLAESGGPAVLDPETASGYAVEAPFLQLVMERLWRATVAAGSGDLALARLQELGGAQRIVENHLLEALAALTPAEQEVAADLFRFLVSPSKRKIAQSVPDLVEWTKRPEPEVSGVLRKLSRSEGGRILRAISPPAGADEASRYELYHDVLAEPILDWRRRYEHARDRRRTIRRVGVVGGGLLALVAVVAGLAAWALVQQGEAKRAAADATSLVLASAANGQRESHLQASLLLALEANRLSSSPEARASMIATLDAVQRSAAIAVLPHDRKVRSVTFSQDGRTLLSGSYGGTVQLWDVRGLSAKPLGSSQQGDNDRPVTGLTFSPDGDTFITASDDSVRLWGVDGVVIGVPSRRVGSPSSSIAVSRDGRLLASGSGTSVALWETDVNGFVRRTSLRSSSGDEVWTVAFSPDGRTLAAGGNGRVQLWDVRRRKPLGPPLEGHDDDVTGVAFSRDGRLLASGDFSGMVRLWDVRRHQPLGPPLVKDADLGLTSVAFSPDGRTLASSSLGRKTVQLWDVRRHEPLGPPLKGHTGDVTSLAFSPDGRILASGSTDKTVRLWDVRSPSRMAIAPELRGRADYITSLAFSPDGSTLAEGGNETMQLWDVRRRKPLGPLLRGKRDSLFSLAISPDGRMLASGGDAVRLWDTHREKPLGVLPHVDGSLSVAFSSDGRTLAAGGNGEVELWDVRSRKLVRPRLDGHTDDVTSVAFSPDGRTLASSSFDGTVQLWNVRSHKPLGPPLFDDPNDTPVVTVAFGPDGQMFASGSRDGRVRLWDAQSRTPLGPPISGHIGAVTSVAFSTDGRTLASAGVDRTVRLWDVDEHTPLATLHGHTASVNSVVFSADGRTLASAGSDGRVRLWEGVFWRDFDELKQRVCSLVGSNLTQDEWEQLASGVAYGTNCPS